MWYRIKIKLITLYQYRYADPIGWVETKINKNVIFFLKWEVKFVNFDYFHKQIEEKKLFVNLTFVNEIRKN